MPYLSKEMKAKAGNYVGGGILQVGCQGDLSPN